MEIHTLSRGEKDREHSTKTLGLLPLVPGTEVASPRPTWDGYYCKELHGLPSVINIYNKDLDLDRNWKRLWEELSHSMSSSELYRKNSMLTVWLYGCYSSFPWLFLPLCKVLRPSLSGSVHARGLPSLHIRDCSPFLFLHKNPFWWWNA